MFKICQMCIDETTAGHGRCVPFLIVLHLLQVFPSHEMMMANIWFFFLLEENVNCFVCIWRDETKKKTWPPLSVAQFAISPGIQSNSYQLSHIMKFTHLIHI